MSKNADSKKQVAQSKQQIDYSRQTISRLGLSATVGVVFSFSATHAYANGVNVPVTVPVMHAVQHVTVTPTTTHTTAAHSNAVTQFNKSSHPATTTTTSPTTNLDLTSTHANVSASLLGSFKTLTLDVGGKLDTVSTTSKLTNAEVVAAQQILNGGNQTVLINSKGAADGGTIQLNSALLKSLDTDLGGSLTAINIPKKVTVDDSLSNLTLTGQLTNAGSLVAQNTGSSAAVISAASIVNSGTISGKNVDLTLTAPTVTNSGTISGNGNVTVNTTALNNAGGTVSASQAVNLGNTGNLSVTGGAVNAPTVNLNAGAGTLSVNGTRLTGVVNDVAANAHVNAIGNYTMGTSSVLNDPLFSTTGNFTITSAVTATNGNDLSIIAGGNIYSAAGASLNTSSTTGNGGNILLVAGANYVVDPTTGNLTVAQSNLSTGGSATGGSINLTGTQAGGAPITSINSSTTANGAKGGNVELVAYAGSTAGSGSVLLPTTSVIQTGVGNANINAGAVDVFAGGKSGTTISLGNINASGSIFTSDGVYLSTSTPVASAGGITISGTTGSVANGTFSTSSPTAIQAANISVGNILNSGNNVQIESGGTVTFKTIDTSGFGGTAGASGANGSSGSQGGFGGEGGQVTITARGAVTGANILTYGGGGGGGGGAAAEAGVPGTEEIGGSGGSGGEAGFVTVTTTTGNISMSGIVNASGGGGGGGGGSVNTSVGSGGLGGSAAGVNLSTSAGSINVAQGIYAVDGGAGGGSPFTVPAIVRAAITPDITALPSAAGGGGGSYGGGGGGGGAAAGGSGLPITGGGGGGGYVGGGGGDSATSVITSTSAGGNGGSGGGAGIPGQGSLVPGSTGAGFSGGTGGQAIVAGGSVGFGGTGGQDATSTGLSGSNVIASGGTFASGNQVSLNATTGIGTAAAPQFILAPSVAANATAGSIYLTTGSDTTFSGLQTVTTGTVSLSTLGELVISSSINAATVNLTTLPLSNVADGNSITIGASIQASSAVTLIASGSGDIEEPSVPSGGSVIFTPTLTATTVSGVINLDSSAANKVSNFQFNTAGSAVDFKNVGSLSIKASSDTGANSQIFVQSLQGTVTVAGAITSAGSAVLEGGTGLALNAQIAAPGGLTLIADTGTITAPAGITNAGPLNLVVEHGTIGALTVNAPTLTVTANAATITDTYTGATTLSSATSDSNFISGAGNFVFNSAGSSLTVSDDAISNFVNITVNDTNATGTLSLGNSAVSATNAIALTTVGGNITSTSINTGGVASAANITFTTKSGNITQLGGGELAIDSLNLAVTGSGTTTTSNLSELTNVTLTSATANNFSLQAINIDIAGKVAAPTINLNSDNNILQTATAGLVSGNSVSLITDNAIGSNSSTSGLVVTLTGTAPTLSLQATNAAVQSTGAIALGASSILNNLTVNSGAALTESGVVSVAGQAFLNGPTVTVNGTLNAANLYVTTPAIGSVTVAAGGVIDSANSNFQTATVNLAAAATTPTPLAGGVIETNTTGAATGSISFSNPTGAFSLAGGGTLGASQFLNITAGGNVSLGAGLTTHAASNETITAKGTVNVPLINSLTVAQDSAGNGGTISVTASALLVNGVAVGNSNPISLSANAASGVTANGGTISLNLTGTGAVTLDNYELSATSGSNGGNGGSVSVKTGGALTLLNPSNINVAAVGTNGNGGNLSLIAATNLSIGGSLSEEPGINSAYGNITLGANGATAFSIGSGTTPVNGVKGTIEGSNITITNASGVAINAANAVVVNATNDAIQPTLTLNTNSVSGTGTISNSSGLAINSTSNLTLGTLGATGHSTDANYGNLSGLSVNAKGNVAIPGDLLNLDENSVSLISTGTLTLPFNLITVVPAPITLNGGSIFISAAKQAYAPLVTGTLNLNAASGSGENGGSVTYNLTSTTPVVIGGGTSPTVVINVTGTTAGGGTVNVTNAGAITLGAGGIFDTFGLDNNISLISTGSTVLVTADPAALNINKGNFTLESNSATALTIGNATTNGIMTRQDLDTGTFTIGNLGGAVLFNENVNANTTVIPTTGYAATVFAKTNITDGVAPGVTPPYEITGPSISVQSTTGSVGASTTPFLINGTNTSGSGTNVSLVSGSTGVINVTDTSTNGDVLTSGTSGSQFIFQGGGSLSTLGSLNETALVYLNAPGAFTQAVGTTYSTKMLDFSLGTMSSALYTNATAIGGATGIAGLTNQAQVTGSSNPTINIIDSTTSALALGTTGDGVTVNANGGTISIVTGGSITVNNNIGGGSTATGNTTLVAGPGGTITEAANTNIYGTDTLTLTSASLGTATKAFSISGGTLVLSSPGLVNIADTLNNSGAAIPLTTVQSINGTVASFTFTANGPITLNNLTSTGNIVVADTSGIANGGITTNAGTQLVSKTGSITLEDTGTGTGNLNLQGNVLAANVNLTTGVGGANITMSGSVGTGAGTVNLIAAQGDIVQTNSGTTVFAKTLNFNAQDIFAGSTINLTNLQTTATAINQQAPATGGEGIFITDQNTANVTVSALTASGANATINFTTGGNLTTLGSVVAGTAANPGNVSLTSGMSMSLGGNVGIADPSGNNATSITVGANGIGLPNPLGSAGLTIAGGSNVLGANITLTNDFPSGTIGTAAAAFNTDATNSLTLSANGAINVANTDSATTPLTFTVPNSQSLNFNNNGASLSVIGVNANAQGGGAISITTTGQLAVGQASLNETISSSGGSITLASTGTGAQGEITVADSTNISTTAGSIKISSPGDLIQIGAHLGTEVTLSATSGISVSNTGATTGAITLGDNVNATATNSGEITFTSKQALTAGDGLTLSTNNGNVILNALNGAIQIGSGPAGAQTIITANGGNVEFISNGTNGSISIANDTLTAFSFLNGGGQISMLTAGALNIASDGSEKSILNANNFANNSLGGISLKGESVNWAVNGATSGFNTFVSTATTSGNLSIALNSGSTGSIDLWSNINTDGTSSNSGNVTVNAGGGTVLFVGKVEAQYDQSANSDNITVTASGVNVNGEDVLLTNSSAGLTSGNISITTNGASGLVVGSSAAINAGTPSASYGNVTLTATNGPLSIGNEASIQAARNVTLSSSGGDLTLGAGGNGPGSVIANNGNINISTDSAHSIFVEQDFGVSAFGGQFGLGNVTFTVGTPGGATTPIVGNGTTINVQNNGGGAAFTTATGFTSNSNPGVTFDLTNATVTVANNGSSASQVTFEGDNVILADPPAAAAVSPIAVNLPSTLPAFSQAQPTLSTGNSIGANRVFNSAPGKGVDIGSAAASGITSSVGSGRISALTNNAISADSIQTEIGTASGAMLVSHVSSAASAIQGVSNNLNSLTTTNMSSASTDMQTTGVLQTNIAEAPTSSNKMLTGGVAANGKRKSSESYIVRELPEGALLVAPERTTVVPTPFGQVQVASRSLALVVSNKDGMSVYNFDDTGRGAITVLVNGENVALEPGRHITVTHKDVERFELVNPAQYVTYRNVRSRMMNGNAKAYFSEFNHFSAIAGLQPLKDLVNSSDPIKRKIGQHMLKTSALLQMLNKNSAPFELMTAPSVTAMK